MKTKIYFSILVITILIVCGAAKPEKFDVPEKMVVIKTRFGDMKVKLYNETPQHRDNFLKLTEEGFFDELLFHRVIKNFMVQGGDPKSKGARPGKQLGGGDLGYTIPAEFNPALFHKKGALSAARTSDDINPEKRSSASQFYIVQGKVWTDESLDNFINKRKQQALQVEGDKLLKSMRADLKRLQKEGKTDSLNIVLESIQKEAEEKANLSSFDIDSTRRAVYKTIGGTPFLDGDYTVFGEVVEGLDIIDSIANVQTDRFDRPIEDVQMRVEIVE